MTDSLQKSREALEDMRGQFQLDARYKAGDSTIWGQNYNVPRFAEGSNWNFNIIQYYINMISGEQRQNRKQLVTLPSKASPDIYQRRISSARSAAISHIVDRDDMLEQFSEAFEDSCTYGLAWQFFYRDFSRDPQFGQLRSTIHPNDEIIFDPDFTKADLSDCNYVWLNKLMSREELKERFPDHAETIDELPSGTKFNDLQINSGSRSSELYPEKDKDKLDYNEYYYRDSRMATFLIHPESREAIEWRGEEEFLPGFKRQGFQVIERSVPTWKQGVVISEAEIYDGPHSLNIDAAPFVPYICYLNKGLEDYSQKFQSITRSLRDTQFVFTYQTIMQFKMVELQINQGLKYKPSSLVDPEVPLESGMDLKVAIKRNESMEDFQVIPRQPMDPTIVQMKDSLIGLAERITGISAQDQGHQQNHDASGISEVLRHAKTRIPWQPILDRFDQSIRQAGRLIDAFVQNNWTTERLAMVTGEPPPEGWNLPFVSRYDVSVREGAYSATQQQAQFQQLAALAAMGAPVDHSDLMKTAPLIYSDKLIEKMEQTEESNKQMMQQKQELEMQREQFDLELKRASANALDSKAATDQVKAQETIAKLPSEIGYKESLAGETDSRSATHIVRVMEILNKIDLDKLKTLHSIDTDQVNLLLNIAETFKKEGTNVQRPIREDGQESVQADEEKREDAEGSQDGEGERSPI